MRQFWHSFILLPLRKLDLGLRYLAPGWGCVPAFLRPPGCRLRCWAAECAQEVPSGHLHCQQESLQVRPGTGQQPGYCHVMIITGHTPTSITTRPTPQDPVDIKHQGWVSNFIIIFLVLNFFFSYTENDHYYSSANLRYYQPNVYHYHSTPWHYRWASIYFYCFKQNEV